MSKARKWKPDTYIRDPLHGMVPVSWAEVRIINSPEFQRLRRIRQLGLTSYVYPGATHTRFEHSIGAMHLMGRALDRLYAESRGKIDTDPQSLRIMARLAALLHDLGHSPLSHATEDRFPANLHHEDYTQRIIGLRLRELIEQVYGDDFDVNVLVQLVCGRSPYPRFVNALLAKTLDVDKLDYLLRDSYYCGVTYGRFDLERILDTLRLCRVGGEVYLAVMQDGLCAVEGFCLAKYSMYLQVYFHKTRCIYDRLLSQCLELSLPGGRWPGLSEEGLARFLSWDDYRLFQHLRHVADRGRDTLARDYANRILDRRHPSEIFCSLPHHARTGAFEDAYHELERRLPAGTVLNRANKHSVEYPTFAELKSQDMPLYVLRDRRAKPQRLTECSEVLGSLSGLEIDVVRVYAEKVRRVSVGRLCRQVMHLV